MSAKRRAQPRTRSIKREPLHTAVWPEITDRLMRDAKRYGVSRSWVQASIVATFYEIFDYPMCWESRSPFAKEAKPLQIVRKSGAK